MSDQTTDEDRNWYQEATDLRSLDVTTVAPGDRIVVEYKSRRSGTPQETSGVVTAIVETHPNDNIWFDPDDAENRRFVELHSHNSKLLYKHSRYDHRNLEEERTGVIVDIERRPMYRAAHEVMKEAEDLDDVDVHTDGGGMYNDLTVELHGISRTPWDVLKPIRENGFVVSDIHACADTDLDMDALATFEWKGNADEWVSDDGD